MSIGKKFAKQLESERGSGRRMLEAIKPEMFDWKPHEKSMTMRQLAGLVADMYGWFELMVDHPELDFAKPVENAEYESKDNLIEWFDKRYEMSMSSLNKASDEVFDEQWTLRNGERVLMQLTKDEVCRQTFGHLAHHRGQLSVYMRLNDLPVPSIYGPTADESW